MKSIFHFRHFDLQQNEQVMKAGTDSVLLGSVCKHKNPLSILDIGTGTGILALMMAQRFDKARITAIDRDIAAVNLAMENAAQSPWQERITCLPLSLQEFCGHEEMRFDLIVSNPPYFKNNGQYTAKRREAIRASTHLPFDDLISGAAQLLKPDGSFWLVLPVQESMEIELQALKQGLSPHAIWNINSFPGKPPIRRIMGMGKSLSAPQTFCLSIYSEPGKHSGAYMETTASFYPGTGKFFG